VDARADIYALGSVLYELVTGCLPHVGANTVTLLDNKVHDKVKPPSQRARKLGLPKYLDRVLLTALATDMKDRYDNVTGMRQDLVWILGSKERNQQVRRRAVGATLTLAGAGLVAGVLAIGGLPAIDSLSARLNLGSDEPGSEALAPTLAAERAKAPKAPLAEPPASTTTTVASLAPIPSPNVGGSTTGASVGVAASPLAATGHRVAASSAAATAATLAGTTIAGTAPEIAMVPDIIPALGPVASASSTGAGSAVSPPASVAPASGPKVAVVPPAAAPGAGIAARAATAGRSASVVVASVATAPTAAPASPPAAATPKAPTVRPIPASSVAAVSATPSSPRAAPAVASASAAPATPRGAPAPSAAPARAAAPEKALLAAESLIGRRNLEALEAYRELGSRYPRDPKVLEGWSRVAASTQWWGESLKVAERWATIDKSAPAQIHLARTQRRLGQTAKAIDTLKALLEKSPKDENAQELLSIYGGSKLALR